MQSKRPAKQRVKKTIKSNDKIKSKNSKFLMIACLCIGIIIGVVTEFNFKEYINNISKYKIVIARNDDEEIVAKDKEDETNIIQSESKNNVESTKKEKKSNEKVKSKASTKNKINKAKKSIIQQCGSEFKEVVYGGKGTHPTKGGSYYIFNIGEDGMGDMQFYVDTNTYDVYEYSVDGYFGPYRARNYDAFTYDMAVRKIENEIGWDERRKYTLVEENDDGYMIRTSFVYDPAYGEGLYYVDRDFVGPCFE